MSKDMTQPKLLVAMALAVLLCSASTSTAQQAKERKNIDDLTPQQLAAYRHAVDVLRNSSDPNNNYTYHANLHNLFVGDTHGCEHRSDLFFPWHRYHLHHFETALQAADPDHPTLSTKDVTIPYWDWSKKASGQRFPKAFEDEFDPNMQVNPLWHDFRNAGAANPAFDATYMTDLIRTHSDWNVFAGGPVDLNEFYGAFEQPSHNDMHFTYIGGSMADPTEAAMDPIYWSFHAFIDMQWDRWQKVYNKPPTSQAKVLRGFPNAPTGALTVDVTELGYFYTHPPESIAPIPPTPEVAKLNPRAVPLRTALAGAERAVAVWGGEGPFTFKLPTPTGTFHRADLWFDDVRTPQTLSYRMEVFIHPADRNDQPADSAGFISVWKGHTTLGGKPHHTHGNLFLTITEPLHKAIAANPGRELAVTLAVKPVPPLTRPKSTVKPTTLPLADEVRFSGVRLILDGGGPFLKVTGKGEGHGH
jgi:hypothetical protein